MNEEQKIRPARTLLLAEFYGCLLAAALTVVLFETGFAEVGLFADDVFVKYQLLMTMELATICLIPLALKMFAFPWVRRKLEKDGVRWLAVYGSVRILMIGLPLVANAVLYYMSMSVAFGYMAIIGGLCLAFVYPGTGRCLKETNFEDEDFGNHSQL